MTNRLINYTAFVVLSLLWIGFGVALFLNREVLDAAWLAFRSGSMAGQVIVTLIILPVVLGLWIWQTSWPLLLRLVLVAGLAWVTVYTFWPGKNTEKTKASLLTPD